MLFIDNEKPQAPSIGNKGLPDPKKAKLDSMTLDVIFSKWNDNLDKQTLQFKTQSEKLRNQEIELFEQAEVIKTIEINAEKALEDYESANTMVERIYKLEEDLYAELEELEAKIDSQRSSYFGHSYEPNIRHEISQKSQKVSDKLQVCLPSTNY